MENTKDKITFDHIHKILKETRCLNREQLQDAAKWKTKRVSKIVNSNPKDVVNAVTTLALSIPDEHMKLKIGILCSLYGIGIPRASAILAMSEPEKYGVIDRYAWKAITGKQRLGFSIRHWDQYLRNIRELAERHGKTPRQIDMALMMYGQRAPTLLCWKYPHGPRCYILLSNISVGTG